MKIVVVIVFKSNSRVDLGQNLSHWLRLGSWIDLSQRKNKNDYYHIVLKPGLHVRRET
jgi:hypothetical protein